MEVGPFSLKSDRTLGKKNFKTAFTDATMTTKNFEMNSGQISLSSAVSWNPETT